MDVGEFLGGIDAVDLLLFLYFAGFFVLGFAQGTIRRIIGIASISFSFFFAANVAEPLGTFLGQNWTQFPPQYSYMVGFLTVFVAASVAFALVVQGYYKPQPLFEKARFADELLGGILGIVQAGLILGFILIILGTAFIHPLPPDSDELPYLRDIWAALQQSQIVAFFESTLIPAFFALTGFLVPDPIEAMWGSGGG